MVKGISRVLAILVLAPFLAAGNCEIVDSESGMWRCLGEVKIDSSLYFVVGTAVETTQASGSVRFNKDGSFEADYSGQGRTPSANLRGVGSWSVTQKGLKQYFQMTFTTWTTWEGTNDDPPIFLKGELGQANDVCVFNSLWLCDKLDQCQSSYWLLTTADQ